jgi:hypothetical protein
MQLAYMISVPGESIAKWGERIISAAIGDLMKKILAEIIDAYGKQQL